jgi:hypothetical protein
MVISGRREPGLHGCRDEREAKAGALLEGNGRFDFHGEGSRRLNQEVRKGWKALPIECTPENNLLSLHT